MQRDRLRWLLSRCLLPCRTLRVGSTLAGTAEDLCVPAEFDAVICHLGLMLFVDPAKALVAIRRALRPVRVAAWAEVAEKLKTFETPAGFVAPNGCRRQALVSDALGREMQRALQGGQIRGAAGLFIFR